MYKNRSIKLLIVASSVLVSSLLLTACGGSKPAPKAPSVQKAPDGPAELYLKSSDILTNVKTLKDVKKYDLTIYLDNYKHASAFVKLSNEGEAPLELSQISFQSEHQDLFTLEKQCQSTISKKEECKLKVSFNGKTKGTYTSDIIINSNSNGKYVGRIAKVHVIAQAKDRITGLVRITSKPKPAIEKKPIIYLDFVANNLVQYLEVKNNGIENINIDNFELIGDDKESFLVEENCPKTLKSGAICDLKITYKMKKNATALSYLVINSNGTLSPSDTVRLRGKSVVDKDAPKILKLADNDNMSLQIKSVQTMENSQTFLEDFSEVKPVYYFRTMYQNNTDSKFKEYFESTIAYYFKKNGFSTTKNAKHADKILNIYPTFEVLKTANKTKSNMLIRSNIKVNIVTKSSKKTPVNEKLDFNIEIEAKNYSDIYFVYASSSNLINSFMFNLLGLEE